MPLRWADGAVAGPPRTTSWSRSSWSPRARALWCLSPLVSSTDQRRGMSQYRGTPRQGKSGALGDQGDLAFGMRPLCASAAAAGGELRGPVGRRLAMAQNGSGRELGRFVEARIAFVEEPDEGQCGRDYLRTHLCGR